VARTWKVLAIRWAGTTANQYAPMRRLIVSTLGLQVKHEEGDFLVADAENGDRFEVFGNRKQRPSWQFDQSPVMVGFLVDDIEAARVTLEADGVELLGPLEGDDSMKWQHFRAPNGATFELTWDSRVTQG
jgi:catechol 2,3-dioxygenase-like lactoylglutathione lyase family enzyme